MKVAILGCGYWGRNLVRNFFELRALGLICDNTASGRAAAVEIAPEIPVVDCVEEVLASRTEAVVIATPAETHFTLAKQMLEADKDVFVEKPLALNYAQGLELVQLAHARGRILMVGHVLEYHPAILEVQRVVRNGELGELQYIYSNRLSLGKIRREENILWSFAPHDIAVILRLMGALPVQVVACGGAYVQPGIADVTLTHLRFENEVRAHIYVSWLHPFKEQRLVVVGSQKMASFDDVTKQLVLYDQRVEIRQGEPIPLRGKGEELHFSLEEPLRLECKAFIHAVVTRQAPIADGKSALGVLRVLQAAQESLAMNGQPINLFPDTLIYRRQENELEFQTSQV